MAGASASTPHRAVSSLRIASVLVAVAAVLAGQSSSRALPIGRFRNLKPVVEVRSRKAKQWTAARDRGNLAMGDSIRTGPTGKTDLLFNNGTQIGLRSNAQVTIEPPASSQKPMVLRVFGALSEVFVRAKSNLEIRTAAGIAGVRSTVFLIQLPAEDTTVLTVIEGEVELSNPQGRVTVAANQQSTAKVGQAPTPPTAVDVSGLMEWTADVVGLPVEFEAPDNLAPEMQAALASLGADRLAEARAAVAGLPDDATALAVLGLVELHSGNNDPATLALQNAVARDPQLYQAHALLALARLTQNQLSEAEKSARRAVELRPDSAQAQGTLAMVLFFRNKPKEATAAANRAVKLNPLSPFALLTQGRVLLSQQKTDAALSAFQQAAALAPGLAVMQTELGAVYQRLDRPQSAEKAYREALKLNPDSPQAHTGLGRALQAQGRTQEARGEHERALQIDPSSSQAHGNLAALYLEEGRLKEADRELEQGVQDSPERGSLCIWMSELMLYRQKLPEAQKFALKAVKLLPKSALAHYQLGRVYFEQQRIVQAEQQYRQATTLDPQLAKARFALGMTRELTESGQLTASPLSAISNSQSGAGQALNVQHIETPGAEDRIQAALQDPTVVRVASRSLGDLQLDASAAQLDTQDYALSYLNEGNDHRSGLGIAAQRSSTDGVRDNADSTQDRFGFHYGHKSQDSPAGWFLLGDFQHEDSGGDTGLTSSFLGPSMRIVTNKPYALLGYNCQSGESSRTRALVQVDQPSSDVTDMFGYLNTDMRTIHAEVRHDARQNDRHSLSLGASVGFRGFDSGTLALPLFPPPPDMTFLTFSHETLRSTEAYVRDDFQVDSRLTLAGEFRLLSFEARLHTETPISPFPSPPTTTMPADYVRGLPKLVASYSLDARSNLRFRARGYAGAIQDFDLLTPTDVFLFGVSEVPDLALAGRGSSYELEYDYTFGNASFLRVGLFQHDLRDAYNYAAETLHTARFRSLGGRYEGFLNPSTTYFLAANLNDATGVVVLPTFPVTLSSSQHLTGVPTFSGQLGLQFLNTAGWFVQPSIAYLGSRYEPVPDPTFGTPRVRNGGYSVYNLRVGKRSGLRSSVFLEVANVFDKTYTVPTGFPETLKPGRQVRLGATRRF